MRTPQQALIVKRELDIAESSMPTPDDPSSKATHGSLSPVLESTPQGMGGRIGEWEHLPFFGPAFCEIKITFLATSLTGHVNALKPSGFYAAQGMHYALQSAATLPI